MIPPPVLAAMLAAAIRSRCPPCPQCGQENTRPAGLGTRRAHLGQVDDVRRAHRSSEPAAAVAAQHRPGTGTVELPERARAGDGQLPAQLLVAGERRVLSAPPPTVQLQRAAPHITRRPQQPEHPVPLPTGNTQPAPRGAVHHPPRIPLTLSRHKTTKPPATDKTRPPPRPGNKLAEPLKNPRGAALARSETASRRADRQPSAPVRAVVASRRWAMRPHPVGCGRLASGADLPEPPPAC